MRKLTLLPVVALLFALFSACSGGSDSPVEASPDVVADQGEAVRLPSDDVVPDPDLVAEDLEPAEDLLPELLSEVEPQPDVTSPIGLCDQPELAQCTQVGPVPEGTAAIQSFAANNALRLKCSEAGGDWDFSILLKDFGDDRIMYMGEVHGSNEIGPASGALFRTLVEQAGVNVLILEIGMDTTAALNEYIHTKSPAAATEIGMDQYSDVMFRKHLPDVAYDLVQEGHDITVVGSDVPQRLAWVNEQLEARAENLDATAQALLLDTMPAPREIASYGMMGIEDAYVEEAEAYYNHVVDNLETICNGLDDDACEEIEYLSYSLWLGSVFVSQSFMMGSMGGGDQMYMMQMMMEREQILIWNFQRAVPDENTRAYAHMGAAHASKGSWNVAGQLDKFYSVTKDGIYSLTPGYGPGSAIFYGFSTQQLPASPSSVASTLGNLPEENYYLSTTHPGLDCSANPLADLAVPDLGGEYGDSYDAFFFYKKLTADSPGGWWYVGRTPREQFFAEQLPRLQYAEELLSLF